MLRAGVCISLKPGQEAMPIETHDEYHFTVSEVTADWYELMKPCRHPTYTFSRSTTAQPTESVHRLRQTLVQLCRTKDLEQSPH